MMNVTGICFLLPILLPFLLHTFVKHLGGISCFPWSSPPFWRGGLVFFLLACIYTPCSLRVSAGAVGLSLSVSSMSFVGSQGVTSGDLQHRCGVSWGHLGRFGGSLRVSGCRGLLGSAWGHVWGHCCRLSSLFPFVEEVIFGVSSGATSCHSGISRGLLGPPVGLLSAAWRSLRGSLLGWLGVSFVWLWKCTCLENS